MNPFKIYYNWLKIIAIAFVIVGVYTAIFSHFNYFLFDLLLNNYFWNDNSVPDIASKSFQGFIYGLTGAVMAAWSVLMLFVLQNGFKQKQKWAWNALLTSVLVWFPIDEFFSIIHGVYINAIFNALLLILFIIPLVLSRKYFTIHS